VILDNVLLFAHRRVLLNKNVGYNGARKHTVLFVINNVRPTSMSPVTLITEQPVYQPRPDVKWEAVEYREIAFEDKRIEDYCVALKSIYLNGTAKFAAFEAMDRDDFLSAYHYDHRGFEVQIRTFLSSPAVEQPFLVAQGLPYGSPSDVAVVHQGGCQFEGLLADVILGGGAYARWKGTVDEARLLAAGCISGLRSLAYARPWSPFVITSPWCPFFHDIAWDYTFIVQFPLDARLAIVCATDTD